MAAHTTSTREPARLSGSDTQNPAVVNVRRPGTDRGETEATVAKPHAYLRGLEASAQLRTVLRLPDLAAAVKRMRRPELNPGAIAQWVVIGLGGLLATWLIFGGRPPASTEIEAPAWAPPGGTQMETAPAAAAGAAAPKWQSPGPAADPGVAPSNQPGPNMTPPNWNDPNWNDSANRGGAPPQSVRTARRNPPGNGPVRAGPPSSEAQRLNVTVPVPQ